MTTPDFQPPDPDIVQSDIPCRKCQYNLRSLPLAGRCPECGTPVGFSTKGDLIRYSDPIWTDTLRRGINCIIWAPVVFVGLVVFAAPIRSFPNTLIFLWAVVVVGLGLVALGAWFLTIPDPCGLGEDKYGTSRKLIRIALPIGVANRLLNLMELALGLRPSNYPPLGPIHVMASIITLVGMIAMLNYLEKLATRIPDSFLAGRAHILKYAIGIFLGCIVASGMLATVGMRDLAEQIGISAMGCLIISFIFFLLMLDKIGKRLKEESEIARATWALAEHMSG